MLERKKSRTTHFSGEVSQAGAHSIRHLAAVGLQHRRMRLQEKLNQNAVCNTKRLRACIISRMPRMASARMAVAW